MGTIVILFVFVAALALWWKRAAKPQPPRRYSAPRRYAYRDDEGDEERYESPLGLVDKPEDEWIEWAIMDDILDGPDRGLF